MKNKTVERLEELTNCIIETNPRIIEGLKDELMGSYMDHFSKKDKDPEGLGYEVYEALNSYLHKKLYGIAAPKKVTDMDQIVMRREIEGYHGFKANALEELFSESRMNIQVFDKVVNSVVQNVAQRLDSETFNKVAKLATEEPSGFKEYLSDLAKKQEIRIGEKWFNTVEMQLRVYSELLHFMMQARK